MDINNDDNSDEAYLFSITDRQSSAPLGRSITGGLKRCA